MAPSSCWRRRRISVVFGHYWRNKPLVFSFEWRCQGLRRIAEVDGTPLTTLNVACQPEFTRRDDSIIGASFASDLPLMRARGAGLRENGSGIGEGHASAAVRTVGHHR